MSENGEIYTADKNFTLPPALTAWTNSNSGSMFAYNGRRAQNSKPRQQMEALPEGLQRYIKIAAFEIGFSNEKVRQ